jgi:hypothetical protein
MGRKGMTTRKGDRKRRAKAGRGRKTSWEKVVEQADRLRSLYPGLAVGESYDDKSETIYRCTTPLPAGPLLSGEVYANGKVRVEIVGTLSTERFARVYAALYE